MSARTIDEVTATMADMKIDQQINRSESEKSSLNLIDLHDDYLKLIFKWLQLKDLLTVVQSSKCFDQLIVSIIARRYAKKWLKISFYEHAQLYDDPEVFLLQEMALILPFLRCFGSSISKLMVRFHDEKEPQGLAVEDYILKYCDQLQELSLDSCRKGAFDGIEKPFEQMEVIRFSGGHLGQNISNFNKWFPKLRSLSISQVDVANKHCIEETMPSLEQMSVQNGKTWKAFSQQNFDESIRSNPQLRSYSMSSGCKSRDLRFANNCLEQLENLACWIHPHWLEDGSTQPIIFEEVTELALNIHDSEGAIQNLLFERDISEKHRLICLKLEQLAVYCHYLNGNYFDFACENDLKKLTMYSEYDSPSIEFLTGYASHWPNLSEVTIQVHGLTSDDIVEFIRLCRHLQRLNIFGRPDELDWKIEELKEKLPQDWKVVSMITKCFYYNFNHSIIRQPSIV